MSTHVQYQSCVIQLPFQNCYGRNVLLAMAEGGDNHLIKNGNSRIAKHWYPLALGDPLDVMTRIIKGSSDCEWGILRFANQRSTQAEEYIHHWRKLLNHPLSVDDAFQQGYSFSHHIEVTLCLSQFLQRSEPALKQMDQSIIALTKLGIIAQSRQATSDEVYPHNDPKVWIWRFDISNQQGWDAFYQNAAVINPHYLYGLHVYGPAKHRLIH